MGDNFAAFYINLDKRPERRRKMEIELESHGIEAERISAIDSLLLDRAALYEAGILHNPYKVKYGEIGCTLSHISAWERLLQTDNEAALIMEDDIELCKDFKEDLKILLEEASKIGYDWIDLCPREECVFPAASGKRGKSLGTRICECERYGYGAFCYIISRKGAEWMLNYHKRIELPIDWIDTIADGENIRFLSSWKDMCEVNVSSSDTQIDTL